MQENDEVLVLKAKNGDRTAFEEMVRRTSRLVFARIYLETGDAHRTEDLLQETLIRAWRALASLSDGKNLRSWLLTIAQNVVRDDARRQRTRKRSLPGSPKLSELSSATSATAAPDKTAERDELRASVMAELRSLPEEYRLPLTLRYITGANYATIETQLGLSNGSLRGLLHRGLKLLRERLGPEFGDAVRE